MLNLLLTTLLLGSPQISSAQFLDDPNDSIAALVEKTVIGGEYVTSDSRVAKAAVKLEISRTNGAFICSGTLIAKDLVLTAAHCVTNLDKPATKTNEVVAVVYNFEHITVANWVVHPEYEKTVDLSFFKFNATVRPVHDLALLKLSSPVNSAALVAELPNGETPVGASLELVLAGFGRTRANSEFSNLGNYLFFAWTTGTIVSVTGDSDHQIEMAGVQPCSGDSGGSVFQADATHLILMGVISHGAPDCGSDGHAISVDVNLPWIRESAKKLRSMQEI